MDQSVVVGPSADAVDPRFEAQEVTLVHLVREILQQEHSKYFLFQHAAGEQPVCDEDEEFEIVLLQEFSSAVAGEGAQSCGTDWVRNESLRNRCGEERRQNADREILQRSAYLTWLVTITPMMGIQN